MSRPTLTFNINRETELPQWVIDSVPSSGSADSAIEDLLSELHIECSLEDSARYLESTGGWTADELTDLDANISRLLWIACLDCQENNTNFFYMGD